MNARKTVQKKPIRNAIWKAILRPPVRNRIVWRLIENNVSRDWLIHQLANYEARATAEFEKVASHVPDAIHGFEDCYWLFSSNELNLSLSQMRFDDAAYLYRKLSVRNRPRVVELGRYKGGTTLMMAAAGADVLSLEVNPTIRERYDPPLCHTLENLGLANRVNAQLGDAYTYDYGSEMFDFVLVHCSPPSFEATRALVRHWWPAIKEGGHLILHATPYLPGELNFIEAMRDSLETWNAKVEPNTPGENVYFEKLIDKSAEPWATTPLLATH